jgi:DNA polymerase-1
MLLAAALQFASLGYPVLPLYPPRWDDEHKLWVCACPDEYKLDKRCAPAKHPIGDLVPRAHLNATTDAARITTWWTLWPDANIGVAPGPAGLIDIAPDSPEWWGEFKAQGLPTTAHFRSGGGDGHEHWLYLRGDIPSVRIARRGEYDVLTDGYFVAPPSRHISGRLYEWIDQVDAVAAQAWMRQFVDERLAERDIVLNDEPVEPAETTMPPVALTPEQHQVWEGHGPSDDRSNTLVDIMRLMAEVGHEDVEANASIAAERDQTLGLHKYSGRKDASRRYRAIAVQYGRRPLQARLAGTRSHVPHIGVGTGERVSDSGGEPPTGVRGLLRWRSHAETLEMRPPQVDWLIEGVFGRTLITEIVAKVKVGKTTFVLGGLRAGIAGDELYCGREVRGPFRVAYVTEEGESTFLEAMRRYGLNDLVDQDAFYTVFDYETLPGPFSKQVDELIEHATADRVDVVILDTLSIIAGLDEEDHAGKAAAEMHHVRRLAAAGFAVGILRHSRKSGGDVGDAGRGSSAISGYCDILLQIEPYKGDEDSSNLRVLKSRSRLSMTEPLILEFDKATERYIAIGALLSKEERLAEKILQALGQHVAARDLDSALTANEITLRVGKRRQDIRAELPAMVARGTIKTAKRKPAKGPEVDVYWSPLLVNLGGDEPVPVPVPGEAERVGTGNDPTSPKGDVPEPVPVPVPVPENRLPEGEIRERERERVKRELTPEQVAKRAEEKAARELARLEAADAAAPTLPYLVVLDDGDLYPALMQLSTVSVGLDTESTGLSAHHDKLRTINLSDGQTHVVIDVWAVTANAESEFPWRDLQTYLDEVGEVRMHTYLFDLAFLQTIGIRVNPSKITDVRTQAMVLESEEAWVDYRLQSIAKRHLAEHVDKREQKSGWDAPVLRHAKLAYAAEDARVTYAVADVLAERLDVDSDAELLQTCLKLERDVQAATWWLASAGAPCDTSILRQAIADQTTLIATRLADLNAIADVTAGAVNWRSPSQVLPILQARDLDLVGTSVDALMEAQSDDPIIDALLAYRSAGTCLGLLKKTLGAVAADGRIYASYHPIGAQTGRTSCSEPNLQQLPHDTAARSAFRPRPGRVFVRADYSQLQIVIAAWLSGDANMQRILNAAGGDIHAATAAAVGCSRQQAKAINFGFLFGAGSDTFRREQRKNGIILSDDQAKAYRATFMRTYPGIRKWHRSLGEWGDEAEVIDDTGSGRRRSRIFSNNVKANTPVQMAEAHGFKLALQALYEARDQVPSARLVMMVHDELIAECDAQDGLRTAQWMQAHMVNAMQPLVDGVTVKVEAKIVPSYADEDKKNADLG